MAEKHVSRAKIAARLGLAERRITDFIRNGKLADGTPFPSRVSGRARTFPEERCFDWYIKFKQEEAIARAGPQKPVGIEEAEKRKAIADAELAELKLARLRGDLLPVDDFRADLQRILGAVRARILSMPAEYAPRIPLEMAAAVKLLQDIGDDLFAEMQQVGAVLEEEETMAVEGEAA